MLLLLYRHVRSADNPGAPCCSSQDAKRLHMTDINTPFSSLQNAIDRLLPFHVRAALHAPPCSACPALPFCSCHPAPVLALPQVCGVLSADAADWEELQDTPEAELAASRSDLASQTVSSPRFYLLLARLGH